MKQKPYNLNYPDEWGRLFKDTRDFVHEVDPAMALPDCLQWSQNIRSAWDKIVNDGLVPPAAFFRVDAWKR